MNKENFEDTGFDQEKYEKKLENTRSAIVGTLAGLIIVTIVMVAVGGGAWWSFIPILGVAYGLFDQLVEYGLIKRHVPRKEINAIKGATGAWFGFILVSYIMNALFGFFNWIALIVEVGTFFGGVYATMDYFKVKRQPFERLNDSPDPVDNSESRGVKSNEDVHYCPLCGNKNVGNNEYCMSCGNKL